MKSFLSCVLVLVAALPGANAFSVTSTHSPSRAAISSTELYTILSAGNKKKNFKAGSPMMKACAGLGIKPKYSCKKGDCASCTISVGGARMKACVGKVPPEPRLKSLQEKGLEVKG